VTSVPPSELSAFAFGLDSRMLTHKKKHCSFSRDGDVSFVFLIIEVWKDTPAAEEASGSFSRYRHGSHILLASGYEMTE